MIRIDEIYSNTFWAWFQQNRPGTRMFMCEPFGRSDADSVINYGVNNLTELNYTFFFDQEPIDLARHRATFDLVKTNVWDLEHHKPATRGFFVTSEKTSDTVEQICKQYGWQSLYYWFHGWAALDWFRGYNRSFLMQPYAERTITCTFVMPNRIIAGERQHRLIMLYHIFRMNLQQNHISCPAICPVENISVHEAVKPLETQYPDIEEVFARELFPKQFVGEANAPMHSYQLSLFEECAESLLYLVTETIATGRRHHLTEKIFKPIALKMPFVLVSTAGSLEYLRSYGFRTFDHVWDETYDLIEDDHARYAAVARTLKDIDELPTGCKQRLSRAAQETCEYNYEHFYSGGFEQRLWAELTDMLQEFKRYDV
jgi:hypothetical protein